MTHGLSDSWPVTYQQFDKQYQYVIITDMKVSREGMLRRSRIS